ncbi:MAG: 50S ribosomal protein L30 [Candidatus Latescibacteria bacterium]|nr:50S ribosomal protein L30 [Candidatus Latescibacterota bacterium]
MAHDGGKLKITQVRSLISRNEKQRRTLTALGIRRIRHSVVHDDTAQIRGMVNTVAHLVEVEPADG